LDFARKFGDKFFSRAIFEAAKDADVLATDVWASMGQEAEAAKRISAFKGYQLNAETLSYAKPDVIVQHVSPRTAVKK
jgi:ornithine carbamoyltransferase